MSDLLLRKGEVLAEMHEILAGHSQPYGIGRVWTSWDAVVRHNQLATLLAAIDRALAVTL